MLDNNTKSWEEVVASPEFHSLKPEQQSQAKMEYFDSVVAPQVKPEEIESARSEFMNDLSDPASQLGALSKNYVEDKNEQTPPEAEKSSVFQMSGLPGVSANLPGAFARKEVAGNLDADLKAVGENAQFGGQVAGNFMAGPAGGIAGGTVGRAVSELTNIMRGKKQFNTDEMATNVGKGAMESVAGEIGGKLLGIAGKFKPALKVGGAVLGGAIGGDLADKATPGSNETAHDLARGAGTVAGATAGFVGPQKLAEYGIRALGNVSKFAAERIAQRGANVVLDEKKMNPAYFGEIAQKASDVFDQLKTQAYTDFQKTADSIKWNPQFKFDSKPIQDELRLTLERMGALDSKGNVIQNNFYANTPQTSKLMEIYEAIRGGGPNKMPKRYMDFKTASQMMNYLDNAIPEVAGNLMDKSASPFVGTLKHIRNTISGEMKNASPVLKQAFEDYSKFADMRDDVYLVLRNENTAETKLRGLLSGKNNANRQAFEGMLNLHPAGKQIMDDLYDASAAKEFYNYTVTGKSGIGKEIAEKGVKMAGNFSKAAKPVIKGAGEVVKRTAGAGISGLLSSMDGSR